MYVLNPITWNWVINLFCLKIGGGESIQFHSNMDSKGAENHTLHIVMEYAPGGDLYTLIKLLNSTINKNLALWSDNNHLITFEDRKADGNIIWLDPKNGDTKRYMHETILWSYLFDMFDGLRYLHDMKIMHRDIKTLNTAYSVCFIELSMRLSTLSAWSV